jgi:hypothetical protein
VTEILDIFLQNSALLYIPAVGVVLALVVLRIKKRYVNDGVLFGRSPVSSRENQPSPTGEESDMPSESQIDVEVALRKIHELGLADGDLGYAYWHEVGRLLQRAAGMQAEIDALSKDLEQCRAMLRMTD